MKLVTSCRLKTGGFNPGKILVQPGKTASQVYFKPITVRKKPINSKFKCSGLKLWHIKDPHEIHPNQQKNGQVPEFLLRKSTFYIYYC